MWITNAQVKKSIRDYCESAYKKKIDVVCDFDGVIVPDNGRCHNNAEFMVRSGKAIAVCECVVIRDDYCILHYINMMCDGSHKDFTLGALYSGGDYRFIRYVNPDSVWKRLYEAKERIIKECGIPSLRTKMKNADYWL